MNNTQHHKVVEHLTSRALEKAKRLSVDPDFHLAIEKFRKRWNMKIVPLSEELFDKVIRYDHVLVYCIFKRRPTEDEWSRLNKDLDTNIIIPFELDPDKDIGLGVAAVCFGLTRENIINQWELMKIVATQGAAPWDQIVVEDRVGRLRLYAGSVLTIAHLALMLHNNDLDLGALAPSVRRWVRHALEFLRVDDSVINPESVPTILESNGIRPNQRTQRQNEILLRIRPETTLADIQRIWPFVEVVKLENYHEETKRTRIWRNFERDSFILEKRELDESSFRDAYNVWLSNHPEEEPVDISSIIRALGRYSISE